MHHPKTKKLIDAVIFSCLFMMAVVGGIIGMFLLCFSYPDLGGIAFGVLIFGLIAFFRYHFGGK